MRKFASIAAAGLTAIVLAACGGGSLNSGDAATGGGGGTGGTGGTGGGGGGVTTYSMGNGSGSAFQSGAIALSSTSLSAGGTTSLTITIVDQTGTLYTAAAVTVNLNSPCVAQGLATIAASGSTTAGTTAGTVNTSTGTVTATYTAAGCSGSDVITATATVGSKVLTASGTVTVAAAAIGSIQFVSASPQTIGLKGTGLAETSTVIFKVVDATGGARPGAAVTFSLDSTVGGLTLSPTTATSAADGTVQTVVSSGTAHTTVRVTAAITSPALTTQSSALTVTTGIPSSNAFSIAVGPSTTGNSTNPLACPNTETWNVDGVTVPVTVRLADRYNNPAPDGTAVAFTTNGGHIVGNCVTPIMKGDGACTATWTSANPRPTTSSIPPAKSSGRATILATAIGEEFYNDANGNGFYDVGESFADLGEPYRDDNENGAYEVGEYFMDFNKSSARDSGDGTFKGLTCSGTTCSTQTLAIGVETHIIMSTSDAAISFGSSSGTITGNASGLSMAHSTTGSVTINVKDANGNAMPAGTKVTASANGSFATLTQTPTPFVVGCDSGTAGANVSFSLAASSTPGSGSVTIQATSPGGTVTVLTIPVTVT